MLPTNAPLVTSVTKLSGQETSWNVTYIFWFLIQKEQWQQEYFVCLLKDHGLGAESPGESILAIAGRDRGGKKTMNFAKQIILLIL